MRLALALVALALLAVASIFAFGGADAPSALASAAAKTAQSSGLRVEMHAVRRPSGGQVVRFSGSGVMDARGGRMLLHLGVLGGDVDEVFVHHDGHLVLYLHQATGARLARGKTWVRADVSAREQRAYGADITVIAGADEDPAQTLRLLQTPQANHVRTIGPRHYRVTVDLLETAKARGSTSRGLRKLRRELGGPEETIDAWVDGSGALRREVVRIPAPREQGGGTLTITTTFTGLHRRAAWSVPPTAEVAQVSS